VSIEPAALHVVATPIGNLGDLTERARTVLAAVETVAAEDTRHTGRLLSHLGIRARLVSLHEHNERQRVPELIDRMRGGASVALVSDAGTPGISDPGYPLVAAAHAAGIRVVPIPGACAIVAALTVSGLPTDRFVFEGFLPAKPRARRARLEALANEARTLVVYESAHRVAATVANMAAAFGAERPATLARELTKAFETVRRDTLRGLAEWIAADSDQQRGEIVLVVGGAPQDRGEKRTVGLDEALAALLPELAPARAAAVAARLTGTSRREAYRAALAHGAADSSAE